LGLYQYGWTQQTNKFGQLERVGDSIFIVENGRRYVVDRNVVTVKLKPGVDKIGKNLKELRFNRLGYIDLPVPEDVDIEDYVSMLEKIGDFDIVEYNNIGEYCIVPDDTRRSEQWYLNSINAYSAWDITMGNSNVIVAILDSGVDWIHPDIGDGIDGYNNINTLLGWNFELNNNNVITTNGHGTRVAGIVGAKTNNARGIAGISGGNHSSGVTLLPICTGTGAPNTAIIDDAIIHAVDNGARVIQLSLSVGQTNAINDAIIYAIQNNVVVVCASGNNGQTVSYPASHEDVIAVGAIDKNNTRASFSNYGINLDVVAPGVDILSTTLNNDYNSQDGTSCGATLKFNKSTIIIHNS
jgi:subtilisin family serine protease